MRCVLASTARSEESISVGGLIVWEPQISLSGETIDCILFLRNNVK
jgi:hypothetical protein